MPKGTVPELPREASSYLLENAMINSTHIKIALKRLERLCETDLAFHPIFQLAATLDVHRPAHSMRDKPSLRAILAVALDVDIVAPFPKFMDLDVDEHLSDAELERRRRIQAERLARFIDSRYKQHGIELPSDVQAYAVQVINRWQPTARTPEVLVHLVRHYQLHRTDTFNILSDEVEHAYLTGQTFSLPKVEEICAMISVLDQEPLPVPYQEGRRRGLFFANIGLIAVRMSVRKNNASLAGAVALFEALSANVDLIARLHVAKMWANGWGPGRSQDFGRANELVDSLYKLAVKHGPFHPWLFHTMSGFEELLNLRIEIKREHIRNGSKDIALQRERLQELANTMMFGVQYGLDYFAQLAELCAPTESFLAMSKSAEDAAKVQATLMDNPFRKIIKGDPVLTGHFEELHQTLLKHHS